MKVKRSPTSICLLCQENNATKKNSHIIPKFFANSFLDNFKGHKITPKGVKWNTIQDSPKENYLFCQDCEKYLGFIETKISPLIKNYQSQNITQEEKLNAKRRLVIKYNNEINQRLFHLFFYSIMFRASVSNHEVFSNFKLPNQTVKSLREVLNNYCSKNGTDLDENILNIPFYGRITYCLFTCIDFPSDSSCGIMASSNKEFAILIANKFAFFISNNSLDYFTEECWNLDSTSNRVLLLRYKTWKQLFIDLHINMMYS